MGINFDGPADEGPGFVGIKFCQECNNMLYPKEDKENRVLLYACRNCDYQQEADNNCIYVNKITHEVELSRTWYTTRRFPRTEDHTCPKCGHREAVFFQAQSRRAEDEMRLYYVCTNTNCTHRWTDSPSPHKKDYRHLQMAPENDWGNPAAPAFVGTKGAANGAPVRQGQQRIAPKNRNLTALPPSQVKEKAQNLNSRGSEPPRAPTHLFQQECPQSHLTLAGRCCIAQEGLHSGVSPPPPLPSSLLLMSVDIALSHTPHKGIRQCRARLEQTSRVPLKVSNAGHPQSPPVNT
ncbi:hypothetical protein HPB48_018765 [Haemaphysalis longicornis]|uniref:TFIIS-type domain-containing protein n=1 Tax=Haemaphysalis longicornis TaxID=44386 RepID=A0A9J6GJ67_HAELO|nr:hypothetical protein HPB48_018765 [Haemaphysalis longicornis]